MYYIPVTENAWGGFSLKTIRYSKGMDKKNILILCGGNSCRSQMAEGFFKFYGCRKANIYSAGTEKKGINPLAVQTMAEEGIDLRDHTCNHIDEYRDVSFDYVITVCDVDTNCPGLPKGAKHFHYEFPDPATASTTATEAELQEAFRDVCTQIKTFSQLFVEKHLGC
jgi:arsenate reductase